MGNTIYYGNTANSKFGRSGNEGKTLAFYMNDNGTWEGVPFGHIRGSNAFEENNGIPTEVGVNVPRFQDGKYFTEGSAKNLNPYSSDFESWMAIGASTTLTSGQNSIIKGSTSTIVQMSVGSGTFLGNEINATLGETYTISVWAKNNGGYTDTTIGFGTSISNPTSKAFLILNLTNEWKRYELSFVSDVTGVLSYGIDNNFNTSEVNAFFDGFQIEVGDKASSYIKTDGATAIRQADTGIQSLVDLSEQINSEEGVLEINIKALTKTGDLRRINLTDGTSNHNVQLIFTSSGAVAVLISKLGGGNIESGSFTGIDIDQMHNYKIKYKDFDFGFKVDDVELWTNTIDQKTNVSQMNGLTMSRRDGVDNMFAETNDIIIHPNISNY